MAHSGKKKGGGEIGFACPEPVEWEFGFGIFILIQNKIYAKQIYPEYRNLKSKLGR